MVAQEELCLGLQGGRRQETGTSLTGTGPKVLLTKCWPQSRFTGRSKSFRFVLHNWKPLSKKEDSKKVKIAQNMKDGQACSREIPTFIRDFKDRNKAAIKIKAFFAQHRREVRPEPRERLKQRLRLNSPNGNSIKSPKKVFP
ncbi:hypothetical protein E1A91_A11G221000v1 [Gossypium mustelinum]|uniref:Uncharacterized protein n=1 Tax=Gossypium mustelinum TaxID=34275 RepID=A0A5D2XA71_GOSMU|nr:hypothetical protein E1A91_A11G221000v1 [Gossypium mustelinum]